MSNWDINALAETQRKRLDANSFLMAKTVEKNIRYLTPKDTGYLDDHTQIRKISIGHYQVFNNAEYVLQREYGGTIKPKGKYLAIPIHKKSKGISAKDFPGELKVTKRGDTLFLVFREGKTARSDKFYYVLKKEVYQPATPFFRTGAKAGFKEGRAKLK